MLRPIIKNCFNLVPKKKLIVFLSNPDYSDNPKHLFKFMLQNDYFSNFEYTWIVKDIATSKLLNKHGINSTVQNTYDAWKTLSKAKLIISSHGNYSTLSPNNQQYLSLWHGMPIKAMGFMQNFDTSILANHNAAQNALYAAKNIDALISTSVFTKMALASSLHIQANKIFVTGQPRTDSLFQPKAKEKLSRIINKNIKASTKILIYLPTFREGFMQSEEGLTIKSNLFRSTSFDIQSFNKFLERNNLLLIAKLHPFEENLYPDIDTTQTNIKILTSKNLQNSLLDLYDVLGAAEILITDYSSVYIDFLLLEKPIIFFTPDFEIYNEKRGFMLEPFSEWIPGPQAFNQKGLETHISSSLCNHLTGENRDKQKRLQSIFHGFTDSASSFRVTSLINEMEI